jgi:YidC/Oxa1 family membrane protein insertase
MNIPGIIDTLLFPIKWVIELILVSAHWLLTQAGLDPNAGLTWVLSILCLVLIVRAALIPLFVRQIKGQRKMMEIAPQLKKIQEKYKGNRDQFSREALSRETMELYRRSGTSPFSSCLPLLVQMPIFFGLFNTLNSAQRGTEAAGVGLLTHPLAVSFGHAKLFGAPLNLSISTASQATNGTTALVITIAVVMIVLMSASQFITQLQIVSKNVSPETKASPMYRQQRMLVYVLPFIFIYSGIAFPLGVMFYWVFSNVWTMGQQFLVIRNNPTPGSEAAKLREERLARKAQRKGDAEDLQLATIDGVPEIAPRVNTQRVQPARKGRAKKPGERRA